MTNPDHAFTRGAAAARQYEKCLVPILLGPWIADLVEWTEARSGHRVLDVACGTGAVARAAAARVGPRGTVVGLDRNPEMLAVARQASGDAVPRIRWSLGDAGSLPFADASFDLVVCQQGLQSFADRQVVAREFGRVLSARGSVAVAVWGDLAHNPYCGALAGALARRLGVEVGRQIEASFALSDLRELRTLLRHTGCESVEVRSRVRMLNLPPLPEFIPSHLAGTSLANVFASADSETRAAVVADVARELQVADPSRDAAFAFEVNQGLGRSTARRWPG